MLVVANVGSSRAVICCESGMLKKVSVVYDKRGGSFGASWLTRVFGVTHTKYISCDSHGVVETIEDEIEFLVLAYGSDVQPKSCGFRHTNKDCA